MTFPCACAWLGHMHAHTVWPCARAWQGYARARGNATCMRVATNRAGILLANMRPGQLKTAWLRYLKMPLPSIQKQKSIILYIPQYDVKFYD